MTPLKQRETVAQAADSWITLQAVTPGAEFAVYDCLATFVDKRVKL